jgi:hypothetical protein
LPNQQGGIYADVPADYGFGSGGYGPSEPQKVIGSPVPEARIPNSMFGHCFHDAITDPEVNRGMGPTRVRDGIASFCLHSRNGYTKRARYGTGENQVTGTERQQVGEIAKLPEFLREGTDAVRG